MANKLKWTKVESESWEARQLLDLSTANTCQGEVPIRVRVLLRHCTDCVFVAPQNTYVEAINPSVMVFGK